MPNNPPLHIKQRPAGIARHQGAIGLKPFARPYDPAQSHYRVAQDSTSGVSERQDPVPDANAIRIGHGNVRPVPLVRDLHQARIHVVIGTEGSSARRATVRKCKHHVAIGRAAHMRGAQHKPVRGHNHSTAGAEPDADTHNGRGNAPDKGFDVPLHARKVGHRGWDRLEEGAWDAVALTKGRSRLNERWAETEGRARQSQATPGKMTARPQICGDSRESVRLQVLALTALKTLSEPEWLQPSPTFEIGATPLLCALRSAFRCLSFVAWCCLMDQFP